MTENIISDLKSIIYEIEKKIFAKKKTAIDKKKNVLGAAGLVKDGEVLTGDEVLARYDAQVKEVVVDTESGQVAAGKSTADLSAAELAADSHKFAAETP